MTEGRVESLETVKLYDSYTLKLTPSLNERMASLEKEVEELKEIVKQLTSQIADRERKYRA
jgi:predicted  nucleic acid-binding Zn-ribbon protein